MTLATIVLEIGLLVSSVAALLPAKEGLIAMTIVAATGRIGRALYQLGSKPSTEQLLAMVEAAALEKYAPTSKGTHGG